MFPPHSEDDANDQANSPTERSSSHSWLNIAVLIVIVAISFGVCGTFGTFYTSFRHEFGWSNLIVTALFSFFLLSSGTFFVVGGMTALKYGTKLIILVSLAIAGLGLFLSSHVDIGRQLFLTFGILLSIGMGAIGSSIMLITNGLGPHRDVATIGILGIGAALGITIMAPVNTWLVSEYGWQDAFLVDGILAWCLIVPAAFFVKSEPACPAENMHEVTISTIKDADIKNVCLSVAILFAYSFSIYMILGHFIPRLESLDFSQLKAGGILALIGAAAVFSRAMIWVATDILVNKTIAIILILLHGTALFWLVDADELWMLSLFAIVYGATLGGIDLPYSILVNVKLRNLFFDKIPVILIAGWSVGAASGPFVAGYILHRFEQYESSFFCAGTIMVLSAICLWGLRSSRIPSTDLNEVNL